jgi:hypothetical protein
MNRPFHHRRVLSASSAKAGAEAATRADFTTAATGKSHFKKTRIRFDGPNICSCYVPRETSAPCRHANPTATPSKRLN